MANETIASQEFVNTSATMADLFSKIDSIHILKEPLWNAILLALAILAISFVGAWVIHFILEKIIYQFTKKTKTKIDDLIVERTKKPFYFIVLFFGLRIALFPLHFPLVLENIFIGVIYSLIIITVFIIISKSVNVIIEEWGKNFAKQTESDLDDQLIALFQKIINVVIILIAIIFVLNQWGVKVTPLLASLGIAGVVLGLALQSTLANLLGGIQLIFDQSVKVGETIKVGNDIGTIEEVGIRSTKMRTVDNELLILPNGPLSNATIQNFAQPDPSVRVVIDFGVEYGVSPKKVKEVIENTLNDMKKVLKKPAPSVVLFEMGDSALKFKAIFWIASYKDRFDLKVEAVSNIYDALTKNKIGIPYPTQTIHLKKDD